MKTGNCRSRLWHALALPSAVAMAATLPGTVAYSSAQAPRRVFGNITIEINDYENFGDDEHCSFDNPVENRVDTNGKPSNYWYYGKCGGEIRAELHYQIRFDPTGRLHLKGKALFFEGTSVNTNDLDQTSTFEDLSFIPTSNPFRIPFNLWNSSENQRNDWAKINLNLRV